MQGDLFGDVSINKKKRAETWSLTTHACRICMGAILRREVSPTKTEFICSECGARAFGASESVLCWCGKAAGMHGKIFRCALNANQRAELPNRVIVSEIPVILKPLEYLPNRKVHCPGSY